MKTTLKTSAVLLTLSLALSTGAASAAPVVTSLNTGKTPQAAGISTIAAAKTFTIELNGSALTEQGFQPSAANEPLVPLRAVAEALGFSLTWNQSSKTAEVTKGNIFTTVKSGENRYTVNKMSTTLGAAPQTLENKLFVPASFVSEVLHQTVSVEGQKIVIASAIEHMTENGVITAINTDAKFPSIQIKGTGTSGLVLNLSEDTVLLKADGTKLTVADLQIGMTIEAEHALFSTRSLPPQTPAYQITVLDSVQPEGLLGTEGIVESINTSQDGSLLIRINGTGLTETSQSEIVLRLPADAAIVNESGEPAKADAIVQGTKVIGFYGPMLTKSLPAIGTAWKIVVLPAQQQ
ncbi:copper amine oxidase N-terminal domain-containing protein [Paenibacillus typhae]|uniref:copper amine oxidase N-terminal domain-containing protein n=1 Tax=Paenibacillus typhae TaxID=1174501 RepID=UPI001C8D3402|nr:copper amine oxidase N-terminal domain-containing protein [Paenibacillus typhae]MBY0009240.1 copper amine oxidase N-terminal domain-containing protein [Paenibacillus typhae]